MSEGNRRASKRLIPAFAAAALLAVFVLWIVPAVLIAETASRTYRTVLTVPPKPVAVVLGAMVFPDGSLSPVLQGRVEAAIDLYRAGKVKIMLMSGDNGAANYNEPTAMKRYAVENGVPAKDIIRDYAGLHTYDTCYRARSVFGITSAVFVTQAFHLPRTLTLAKAMGIDAVGFVAPDNSTPNEIAAYTLRERVATLGAMVDLALHRKPKFPGPPEAGIFDGSDPNR